MLRVCYRGKDVYYRRLGDLCYILWLEESVSVQGGVSARGGVSAQKSASERSSAQNADEPDKERDSEQKSGQSNERTPTNNWNALADDFNRAVRDAVSSAPVLALADPYAYERIWSCVQQFGVARAADAGKGDV